VSALLDDYGKFIEKQLGIPSFPIKERLKASLEKKNDEILAFYENDIPIGIVRITNEKENLNETYITAFYCSETVGNKGNLEKNLFNEIFNKLKNNYEIIRVAGMPLSSKLRDHIVRSGFRKFNRWRMSVDKSTVQSLIKPSMPSGYAFNSWTDDFTEPIVEVIFNYNDQSVDNELFTYFKCDDTIKAFIEDLKRNRWGKFDASLTRVLIHKDKLIGVCFLTVLDNGNGYIPDLGILKTYQGKKLGKKLLIHSLKHYIDVQKGEGIELDVTLENTVAFNLYKSIGFKLIREYPVFVWKEN
jgi:ribosomal protein S18 acetylase RimI-like enzyme